VFIRGVWVSSGRGAWVWLGSLTLVVLLFFAGRAEAAAVRTWDGGCGAETAWSCAANWSGNVVPGAADTALFNSTSSGNSTVDAGFAGSVGSVTINTGYAGTISLARPLAVAVGFTQKTGTFTAGGQALTLKNFTLSGGAFTASSGTTSIAGALKISGSPTFSANGGAVNFNGGGGTLSCNNVSFNEVTITNTAGTKTVGLNCSLPLGANPSAGGSGGSISLNGTLSGTGTLTNTKTLILGATGTLSGFNGLQAGALTVNGPHDFGEYEAFDVNGNFILGASGNFTAPEAASFARNFTINAASTFDANEGTIEFDGSTPFTVACGGKTFNLVTFSAGHKTINSDCTLPLGEDPSLGTGGTTLKGTLSGSGKLTQAGTFKIESSSPGLDSFSDVTDVGALTVAAGTAFTAPEGELIVQGNFVIDASATFDANDGIVSFQGLGQATKTITCNGALFNMVVLANTTKQVVGSSCTLPLGNAPIIGDDGQIVVNGTLEGTGTLATETPVFTLGASGSLTGFSGLETGVLVVNGAYDFGEDTSFEVGGDFTLGSGASFTAPAGTASFAGDFVNAGGTFDANEGTVALTGAGQQIKGSTAFFNLEKVAAGEDTLTFAAGATQTIEGALTLEGAEAGKLLKLVSSEPTTRWKIEAKGSRNVEFVSVKDSEALGTAIEALESVDAGNNLGWEIFP
jgi:hypothetical protein